MKVPSRNCHTASSSFSAFHPHSQFTRTSPHPSPSLGLWPPLTCAYKAVLHPVLRDQRHPGSRKQNWEEMGSSENESTEGKKNKQQTPKQSLAMMSHLFGTNGNIIPSGAESGLFFPVILVILLNICWQVKAAAVYFFKQYHESFLKKYFAVVNIAGYSQLNSTVLFMTLFQWSHLSLIFPLDKMTKYCHL